MDKYQKRINDLPHDKRVALAEGYGRIVKFAWIISILVCGSSVVIGLYFSIFFTNFPTSLLVFFVGGGLLMFAVFAWIILDYQKMGEAAAAEVSARGLDYKVNSLRTEKQAERKIVLPLLAVLLVIVCLVMFGLKACGGDYTRCPKCGSLYDTGNGGANYIDKYGKCAKCDYDD